MSSKHGGSRFNKNKKTVKQMNLIKNNGVLKCEYCSTNLQELDKSKSNFATIDHFVPLSKGGTHAIINLLVSCKGCNHDKGALFYSDWCMSGAPNELENNQSKITA